MASKLNILVPDSIRLSVKKRQAELLAGRYMAKLCLEALSVVDRDVLIGYQREPMWPEGVTSAICMLVIGLLHLLQKKWPIDSKISMLKTG
ncbi:hypothetical protein [Erwinia aphidicola]|uniref:hypothetical protein n=1 Tax=Erwinia aphidicola TaxID=68334 RepID=UPI003AFB2D16